MSTQILTELPRIQKTGMDFDSVMTEIRNIVRDNPNWKENWNEFYDSEAGTMLCSLMAWVADNMSSRQDLLYNEMFIGTAQDDRNKIRHLKQIGYIPKMAHSSKVPIKIVLNNVTNSKIYLTPEYLSGDDLSSRPSKIFSFSGRDINGKTINWEILPFKDGKPDYKGGITLSPQEIEYKNDINGEKIYAYQGKTVYEEFTIPTSDGSYFDLKEKNIASDTIQVYKKDTGELLKEAKSFLTIVNENKDKEKLESPYIIEMNESRGFRIKFAGKEFFDEKKLLKAGTIISILYRTCEGALGNIKANYISQSTNFINADGDAISANIYNELPAVEGANMESLDEAVKNGPTTLITMNRAVTPDDYDIVLNNNTNIFKTKTYTASNQPKTFKDYYGRYINPQESFVFTLLNKQHEGVPTEQYNYFPWITTIRQPRLNEKYVFDKGKFNNSANLSITLYNSTLSFNGSESIKFTNSTLIDLGSDFNSYVKKDNDFLELILTSKPTDEERLNNIIFDILGDSFRGSLTVKNNILENNDFARFISKGIFDTSEPVDVTQSRILTFVMNDESEFKIDFSKQFKNIDEMDHAYLLWDNIPQPATIDVSDLDTKESAKYRKGIVQIINDSVNNASSGEKNDNYFSYSRSKQLFGLENMNSGEDPTNISNLTNFRLEIDNIVYDFTSTKNIGTDYNTIINYLNTSFKNPIGVMKVLNGEKVELSPEDIAKLKEYEAIIYRNRYKEINSKEIISISITSCDIAIAKKMGNGEVVSVQDPENSDIGLISILRRTPNTPCRYDANNLPDPMPAADYRNIDIACMKYIDSEKKNGKFCLQTTYKGKYAKLFFEENNSYDFGKNTLRIPFINDGSKNNISPKSNGVRKAVLITEDVLRYYSSSSITDDAKIGNIIFQNSCMFNDYDFKEIYASYKLEKQDVIEIGSKYDNYYYSGNDIADRSIKDNTVYGILGQVANYEVTNKGTVRRINMDESNFNIKITKEKELTNSLFAIESDLDAIPSDYASITTASLDNLTGKINLEIDDEEIIALDLNGISNGIDLKNEIRKAVSNIQNNKKLLNKFDHIFSVPFDNIKQLTIKSLSKQNGSIKFIADAEAPDNTEVYNKLFGTKDSNKELYELYADKLESGKDYFYPELESPLEFNYRIMKDGVPRSADYYIDVQAKDNKGNFFTYYLKKTANSKFPNKEFYMHFINDQEGSNKETDEGILQKYMKNKIVSGTDIIFLQPYFKSYDIFAEVTYLPMFNETEIKNNIIKSINNLCGLKNAQISGSISQDVIYKAIMNVSGVSGCSIKYFGYNVNNIDKYPTQESIKSDFYEISFIHETTEDGRGLKLNLLQQA